MTTVKPTTCNAKATVFTGHVHNFSFIDSADRLIAKLSTALGENDVYK